jgi:23S rRNA (cytidine1920-2'-O)/16S rRNA (cytidine1409-2'-O)-methyltransferase
VVGFDVGHGQLHQRLRGDPRVVALEGLHVRELPGSALAAHAPPGGFDLIVADLSFISLAGALVHLAPWLRPGGAALLLAKPQFEVGRAHVGKGGLVRDAAQIARVEAIFREACAGVQWTVLDYFASALTGGDGNPEFIVSARAPAVEQA